MAKKPKYFGSKTGEIVDLGVDHDILDKSGSWYAYAGSKIAQGREGAKQFFEDNPEVALEVENKIKAKITGKDIDEPKAAAEADNTPKGEKA